MDPYVVGAAYEAVMSGLSDSDYEPDYYVPRKSRRRAADAANEVTVDLAPDQDSVPHDAPADVTPLPLRCLICYDDVIATKTCDFSEDHVSCFNCLEQTVLAKLETTCKDLPGCCWAPACAARITPETLLQECTANTRIAYLQSLGRQHSIECAMIGKQAYARGYEQSSLDQGTFDKYKNDAIEIILVRCPCCRDPFYEWQNCGAVVCEGCGTEFCVACLKAFHDVHKHIREGCTALRSNGVSFSRHDFALMHFARIQPLLKQLLRGLTSDMRLKLRDYIRLHPYAGPTVNLCESFAKMNLLSID